MCLPFPVLSPSLRYPPPPDYNLVTSQLNSTQHLADTTTDCKFVLDPPQVASHGDQDTFSPHFHPGSPPIRVR